MPTIDGAAPVFQGIVGEGSELILVAVNPHDFAAVLAAQGHEGAPGCRHHGEHRQDRRGIVNAAARRPVRLGFAINRARRNETRPGRYVAMIVIPEGAEIEVAKTLKDPRDDTIHASVAGELGEIH